MRVAVLAGGRSGEHEISLLTAEAVHGALASLGYQGFRWTLGRDGGATWDGGEGSVGDALVALERLAPDAVFVAMHGVDGEDGTIQGALDLLELPYQGAGVVSSALAMDKAQTKAIYRDVGLRVAADVMLEGAARDVDWASVAAAVGLPLVLKTVESGSSVDVERVDSLHALEAVGAGYLHQGSTVLAEAYLPGREFTCAVLEDLGGEAQALPLVEIVVKHDGFFDYRTKYDPEAVDEICPAPIDDALAGEISAQALEAHRVLGCRHYSRTDMMLNQAGDPVVLETNTLPGLTPASLFPKSAAAAGMSFPDLIQRLLALAVG